MPPKSVFVELRSQRRDHFFINYVFNTLDSASKQVVELPLMRISTIQRTTFPRQSYNNIASSIIKAEGVSGLFKLQPYYWLDSFLHQSLNIVSREVVKAVEAKAKTKSVVHASSALASIFISYSLESLQIINSPIEPYNSSLSIWKLYRRRVKQFGHASLFRGAYLLLPSTFLNLTTGAFLVYLMTKFASLQNRSEADVQTMLESSFTKHAMEILIQLSSYPLETIRYNMVQQNTNNISQVVQDLYEQGGISAFYSGAETIVLQSVLLYAIDKTVKPLLSHCKHKLLQWFK